MTRLGDLERAVMDVLWDVVPGTSDGVTVREVADALDGRELAYTTVMTVLDRLAGKGMVQREREGRAWRYRPAASREAHIAQLMLDALDLGGSRDAALVRFARSVTGTEAEVLRAALETEAGSGSTGGDQGGTATELTDRVDGPTGRRPAGEAAER
ncbi:BlaI/MecI/CopY family transcriptional regulator [Micromonospora sp. DT68]|uniref:BlaI/MecI/CopY family transcriptional regulator n=1 Tax=Micromonospora profundi TaxID=1420889 RepID=A0AAJ6HTV1_9ACTN|nr:MULTISPECIES: BlaI/MecI/CopY family transcriptional regulator [Micromonospora]NJC14728.1 putative transcriptional regulator [Micromonospora profundi]WLS46267.1 BlaI/MecI/CopY family transcriptional regulator [Micromonospora profundi]